MTRTAASLRRNWFLILLALADAHRHGLAISREVLKLSGGRVRLWPATLYGTLEAMCRDGLIRELIGRRRPAGASEKRRYYRITGAGRRALSREARRLEQLALEARRRVESAER